MVNSSKCLSRSLMLLSVCLLSQSAKATYAGSETSTYVFVPDQSTVVQTGGIAGIHWTYSIEGQFQLTVDPNAGAASFDKVDANLTDAGRFIHTRSLGELFNMTELSGTILDDASIRFDGVIEDGSSVSITLTFSGASVHLIGQTIPPPNSADFFVFSLDAVAQRKYGGGTGEPDNPYLIYTAEEMNAIGAEPNDWDKHFKLMADIDLSGSSYDRAPIAPDIDPVKVGFQGFSFTGVFDGKGHTISHLTIQGGSYVGLFGRLLSRAKVNDLGAVDVNISGSGDCVGGLVGNNGSHAAHILDCYSTGAVSGGSWVGGLVGYNTGDVIQSHSAAAVSGSSEVGGVVGDNWGNVTQCYSTGAVSGSASVGGLVGANHVVGAFDEVPVSGHVTHCYSSGAVTGGSFVGGLVGYNGEGADVRYCYSTGAVSGTSSVGGLVGGSGGSVTYCFWDIQTSGQATSAGGVGKTTPEMQTASTFRCWVFEPTVWTIDEGKDYPKLWWENAPGEPITRPYYYGGGSGTQADPYLIYTAEQLDMIGLIPCDWDRHFKLMADIDLDPNLPGRKVFDKAVIAPDTDPANWEFQGTPFAGTFDGNGHTISHLRIQGKDYVGLFGQLASGAEVKDLGAVDVNIAGSGGPVGGLIGSNGYRRDRPGGNVTRCYSTGAVSSQGSAGGLVGDNYFGTVTDCYATSTVVGGEGGVGGLAGFNVGTLRRCYSTGVVSGGWVAGGLVGLGEMESGRENPFWGVVTDSFWDTETSGQTTSDGGTGKTTAEMQTASTFLDAGLPAAAGWDFVGETANGTEDIWTICEGQDYPKLAWQFVMGDYNGDGHTDFMDLCIFGQRWLGTDSSFWCGGGGTDLTNDGFVDFEDLTVFAKGWLTGMAP